MPISFYLLGKVLHLTSKQQHYDTVIIGAGAAGMMCAAHTHGDTLVVDHAKRPGEKIRISGGGRCNFTNLHTDSQNFISANKHFAKSALKRYTQQNFVELVRQHKITYHEKTLGQLFCDNSAKDIIDLLLDEMMQAGAELRLSTTVISIEKVDGNFSIILEENNQQHKISSRNLVIACGGRSIPKMGATGLGYQIAEKFNHPIVETRPALVPLTFSQTTTEIMKSLAGIAIDASVSCGKIHFNEAILFTHRGLSGPAILQISSYWNEKETIKVALLPGKNLLALLRDERLHNGRRAVQTFLAELMPKNLASAILTRVSIKGNMADQSDKKLQFLADAINQWVLYPIGSEGYRTAEVTLGGVDTKYLSSTTMESKNVKGLYFIGEVVDVTGWLGGYNFQWAWSSGWAAGTAIANKQ